MKTLQKGFTLIELVVVIVILGILGAVAVPRFVDLSSEAEDAAALGVAGAISSGMAINYAACEAGSAECVATIDACDAVDAGAVLNDATALADYTFGGTDPTGHGLAGACTITLSGGTATANYTAIQTAP